MLAPLFSFDGTESALSDYRRGADIEELCSITASGWFTPRGAGLSYCGASIDAEATIVESYALDKILEFNPEQNYIKVESGVRIGFLLQYLISNNYWLEVIPGHPSITIGGCIGFNVHGKNQWQAGNFENCVIGFELFHPDRGLVSCSRVSNADIFNLTIGGMGLTGFIVQASLKIVKLDPKRRMVKKERKSIESLKQLSHYLIDIDVSTATQIYTWHDLNQRGENFGRGFIFTDTICEGLSAITPMHTDIDALSRREKWSVPYGWQTPVSWMSGFYKVKQYLSGQTIRIPLLTATFPIAGSEAYFYQFGKKGFREYQCIIPKDRWGSFADALQREIEAIRIPIALASVKVFSGARHLLHFSAEGICLAIDVANTPKAILFFEHLDRLMMTYGGVVNLSKDSRLRKNTVAELFPEYELFRDQINAYDSKQRIQSLLRRRLEL